MTSGYDAGFYRNIDVLTQSVRGIESSLNRIANCMEAAEKRAREHPELITVETDEDTMYLDGRCRIGDCQNPVVMMLNGERFCRQHIDAGFVMMRPAMQAVKRGFDEMEQAVREQREADPDR